MFAVSCDKTRPLAGFPDHSCDKPASWVASAAGCWQQPLVVDRETDDEDGGGGGSDGDGGGRRQTDRQRVRGRRERERQGRQERRT